MIKKNYSGVLFCMAVGLIAYLLGKALPIIGGPVFAILLGILLHPVKRPHHMDSGIQFSSKKILQLAVILLGFGLNLKEIIVVGKSSLLIILSTISCALILSFFLAKILHIEKDVAILVGVGSSICGGSAIAATAPVIEAKDEDIATAISVIFLFNIIAALIFPSIGANLGFSHEGFGMWAGTAINDTSSVVAAGQTWSTMFHDDTALQYATIVKLTRTLAIIPITFVLGIIHSEEKAGWGHPKMILQLIPKFILLFLLASVITTFIPLPEALISLLKDSSKYFITVAMAAIGLKTNLKKLMQEGGKPILQGLICWVGIICVSLLMQKLLGIW